MASQISMRAEIIYAIQLDKKGLEQFLVTMIILDKPAPTSKKTYVNQCFPLHDEVHSSIFGSTP